MIKLTLQYEWRPGAGKGSVLDTRLFDVLYAVHASGSIAAAARETGMSYRHVWGMMGTWERRLGRPLVTLKKGRGAKLTEFGRKLLWAQELVQARLAPDFDSLRHEIESALAHEDGAPRLAICASHDLALAELRDRLMQGGGPRIDLRFQGSLESLAALTREQCDLAGFHIAEGLDDRAAAAFARAARRLLCRAALLRWMRPLLTIESMTGVASRRAVRAVSWLPEDAASEALRMAVRSRDRLATLLARCFTA